MQQAAQDETSAAAQAMAETAQGLAQALGGGQVQGLQRLSGGASQETWAFELDLAGKRRSLILRRAPAGGQRSGSLSAGAELEFALLGAAAAAGVPTPATVLLLRPEMGLGRGYVMQRLAGETLGRRIVSEARFASARQHLARQCGQALARIHALPMADFSALRSAQPDAEVTHYENWHRQHGTHRPVFQLALRWLREHLPPPGRLTLVHGDFRNGNLMVDEQGLAGVLDWELAHIGDPMQDLGWLCVNSWRFGRSDLPVGGFGRLDELFAGYTEAGGVVDAARVHFWQLMGSLKWGVMCDSFAQAWLDGADRSVDKAAIGRRASETEIDLLALLAPRSRAAPAASPHPAPAALPQSAPAAPPHPAPGSSAGRPGPSGSSAQAPA